ncbi:MAG: hypothetical protein LBI95_01595, partial [Holosporales bacterium]|nr:hypothetical protein [Holosporales bacterium]
MTRLSCKLITILSIVFVNVDCYCMELLQKVVFCSDPVHHKKTAQVFNSSFLLQDVKETEFFERVFFENYIKKIYSYTEGRALLDRLDVLFNIYSSIKKQPVHFFVSFLNSASCFGGKFLSASDAGAYKGKLFFDSKGASTAFKFDSPMVNINLNLIGGTLYHDELGLCTVIQSLSKVIELPFGESSSSSASSAATLLCSVCDCADPYWML